MIRPEPCFKCSARGSCRHRAVDDVEMSAGPPIKVGQGNAHSPWGAKGNPAGKARQRIIDLMKARLFEEPKKERT